MDAASESDYDGLVVRDRWDGGVGWTLPDDDLDRSSHALATDEGLYLCDPIDAHGLDDLLADYGEVAGVVLQLDRHERDCAAVARRHDVPVYLPGPLSAAADGIDAETEAFVGELGDTGYHTISVVDNALWREAALTNVDEGTLVVAEALGTNDIFCAPGERLGVHPGLRLFPPRRAFGNLSPDRILVGHGPGVFDDAPGALRTALDRSRTAAPRLYASLLSRPFR